MPNPLQQAGSGEGRGTPLWTNQFFTGLWTQRNPLKDPGTRAESMYYGGRPEALISGVNVELTNLLTLARRPGTSAYSLQTVSEAINSFYSFKTFTTLTESIQVMTDGLTKLYTVTPAAVTSFFTKGAGAGPASFLGINNTLYIGDGVEERAYNGIGTTGYSSIAAISNTALTSNIATYTVNKSFRAGDIVTVTGTSNGSGAYNITNKAILTATSTTFTVAITHANVGTAADSGTATVVGSTRKWGIAPGGVTLSSAYAGTGASGYANYITASQGPSSPALTADSALPPSFYPWLNPTNAEVLDNVLTDSHMLAVQSGGPGVIAQGESTYLTATNFGFSVPASATITGVAATAYKQETSSSDSAYAGSVADDEVYLVTGGTVQTGGTNHAAVGAWTVDFISPTDYGSSSDTWSTVVTPAIVNGSDFGVAIRAITDATQLNPITNGNLRIASVDYISVAVYYTVPTNPSWTNASNVTGAPNAAYATAVPSNDIKTAALIANNYGFATTGTVTGIVVDITGHLSASSATTTLYAQLQDNNGNPIGILRSVPFTSTSDTTVSFGGSADVWGALLNSGTVNANSATITNTVLTSNVATYTAANTFVPGQVVTIAGTTNDAGTFNVSNATIVSASTTQFAVVISHANVGSAGDTGTAKSGMGVLISVSGNGQTFSIDAAQIQIYTSAISASVSGSAGSFTAVTGYKYGYAYANTSVSPPVFSNMSAASATTGAFTNKLNVGVSVAASTDPQVNAIWVFRTRDGGSIFQSLPTNPYPNTTATILDSSADATLNEFQLAARTGENSPPLPGTGGMVFHMGRMWAFVNNVLYYATGPDLGNILGNPYESWSLANFFTLPSKISKLIPTTVGLLVHTISDIYIVYGTGSAVAAASGVSGITVFYVAPFVTGVGLLSQFAADINGTTIYMFTADKQQLSLDPSSGISEIGFPIGSQCIAYPSDPALDDFDPASAYVSWHVSGSQDKALYTSDGSTGWFRCNTSQAPEGGFVWSPKANITGGCKAIQSIETSPGVHQLMIGPGEGGGTIQYRNTSVFSDVGIAYPANFIMGSIVLAYPGQLAQLDFITCDFDRIGTSPIVSVLPNEISGAFYSLSGYVRSDPPSLYGVSGSPETLFSNRYDFAQSVNGGIPPPLYCRHLQVKIDFGSDGVQNEILTFTIYGSHWSEK